jgi:hypothetical protein
MEPKILGVGPRTAAYLRTAYSKNRAKLIARDFHVSEGTAERWLRGEAPTVAHIEQITVFFGSSYIRAVFTEAFEQQDQRIKELEEATLGATVSRAYGVAMENIPSVQSLTDRGLSALRDIGTWAGGWFGHASADFKAHQEAPDDSRIRLIKSLIATVADRLVPSQGDANPPPSSNV